MVLPRNGWDAGPNVVRTAWAVVAATSTGLGTCRMPLNATRLIAATAATVAAAALSLTAAGAPAAMPALAAGSGADLHSSIVVAAPGQVARAAAEVRATGGSIGKPLAIINGFTAMVPSSASARLNSSAAIESVTANSKVQAASE